LLRIKVLNWIVYGSLLSIGIRESHFLKYRSSIVICHAMNLSFHIQITIISIVSKYCHQLHRTSMWIPYERDMIYMYSVRIRKQLHIIELTLFIIFHIIY
jgi:uncharacterized membrane protein YbjE (DUF340 family)